MKMQTQVQGSYRSEDMVEALDWMLPQAASSDESIVVLLDRFSGHLTEEGLEGLEAIHKTSTPTEVSLRNVRADAMAFVDNGYKMRRWEVWDDYTKLIEDHDNEDEPAEEGLEAFRSVVVEALVGLQPSEKEIGEAAKRDIRFFRERIVGQMRHEKEAGSEAASGRTWRQFTS